MIRVETTPDLTFLLETESQPTRITLYWVNTLLSLSNYTTSIHVSQWSIYNTEPLHKWPPLSAKKTPLSCSFASASKHLRVHQSGCLIIQKITHRQVYLSHACGNACFILSLHLFYIVPDVFSLTHFIYNYQKYIIHMHSCLITDHSNPVMVFILVRDQL